MQPTTTLAFFAQDHTASLRSPWGLPTSSGPLLPNCFPGAWLLPATYRTLHSPLLNLMILLAHFSSLSGSVWTAAQPSGVPFSSHSFVASSAHLLMRTCSIPPSRLLTQILNRNGLRTDPQSIPLVTHLQTRLCATYHHPLGLVVQAVFNPLVVCSSSPCSISLPMRILQETVAKAFKLSPSRLHAPLSSCLPGQPFQYRGSHW